MPGSTVGNHRARELVNKLAEHRVLLRRPADDRERPDGIAAAEYMLDLQHRKRMRKAVVTEVIAERSLGQQPLGIDRADDAEIAVGSEWASRLHGGSCARGAGPAPRQSPARSCPRAAA